MNNVWPLPMQNTGSVFAAIYSLTHSLRLTLQMLVGREMDGETRRGREGGVEWGGGGNPVLFV